MNVVGWTLVSGVGAAVRTAGTPRGSEPERQRREEAPAHN